MAFLVNKHMGTGSDSRTWIIKDKGVGFDISPSYTTLDSVLGWLYQRIVQVMCSYVFIYRLCLDESLEDFVLC